MKILVILVSIREKRMGEKVAKWVMQTTTQFPEASFELIDLKNWPIPYFTYPTSAVEINGNYDTELEKAWSKKVSEADGFLIVTPEYNHSYPAQLKSAIDLLYNEWNNKAMSFVSYGGGAGGARAVEQLRLIASELQIATPRSAVNIKAVWQAFDEQDKLMDSSYEKSLQTTIQQLLLWTKAMKTLRN